jgi:hypothetical protein
MHALQCAHNEERPRRRLGPDHASVMAMASSRVGSRRTIIRSGRRRCLNTALTGLSPRAGVSTRCRRAGADYDDFSLDH